MQAVEKNEEWTTHWVTDPKQPGPSYPARELLDRMADCAWHCGDPGVQYDTTINHWHTCPNSGRINASNPCSEYMFLDNTACNLASINLMKFRQADGTFDVERFKAACRIYFIAQEILVDHASYPTRGHRPEQPPVPPARPGLFEPRQPAHVERHCRTTRDAAHGVCGAITALLHGAANLTSAELAAAVGPFDGLREEPRADAPRDADASRRGRGDQRRRAPSYLQRRRPRSCGTTCSPPAVVHGYRNAQATVLAPTGTISFMMDCDTTGIEPDIALVKYKQLAGGGMLKIVNQTVPLALKTLGYDEPQIELDPARTSTSTTRSKARPPLKDEHLPVFDCAFKPRNGTRSHRLAGPRADDGRRSAVPLRRDLARR